MIRNHPKKRKPFEIKKVTLKPTYITGLQEKEEFYRRFREIIESGQRSAEGSIDGQEG